MSRLGELNSLRAPARFAGFTLLELLVVVAVIGILLAVAIPAYNAQSAKARVSELLAAGQQAEKSVMDFYNGSGFTSVSSLVAGAGVVSINNTGNIASLGTLANGVIQIIGTNAAGPSTISLTPTVASTGVLVWSCSGTPTTNLPSSCR